MFKSIIKYGVSEGLAKMAPFLTTLYVANYLAPESFGKYSLLIVMFEIFFILISFNIQATTRIDFFKLNLDVLNKVKQHHFLISIGITVITVVSFMIFSENEYYVILILSASALLKSSTVTIQALFQCEKKVNKYLITNVIFFVTQPLVVFVFLKLDFLYLSWLYAILISCFLQFILSVYLYGVKKYKDLIIIEKFDYYVLKSTFLTSIFFMPQALGWWFKSGADRFIISNQIDNSTLGNFSLAFQLAALGLIFVRVLNLVLVPELNRLLKGREYKKIVYYFKLCTFVVFMVFVFDVLIGGFIINYYYIEQYPQSLTMFYLLNVSLIPQALILLITNVLYFKDEGKYVAKVIFISFSIQIGINFIFVGYFGIVGLILNSFIFNLLVLFFMFMKTKELLK